ncbi:MAG TPA: hypothetical protein VIM08_08860 [Arthrobacter sp.]|jgi:hypothetical protein
MAAITGGVNRSITQTPVHAVDRAYTTVGNPRRIGVRAGHLVRIVALTALRVKK